MSYDDLGLCLDYVLHIKGWIWMCAGHGGEVKQVIKQGDPNGIA